MQTSPTFLQLFILACQGDYTPKTVPAETEPPFGLDAIGAASRTALSLCGLAADIRSQIAAAEEATKQSGRQARRSRLSDLVSTVDLALQEGGERELENDRLRAQLKVVLRTLQLLLFAEHPTLRSRDPGSVALGEDGEQLGALIISSVIYAGPEDEGYATLPASHPATRLGLNLVLAIAGEDRHSEIGAPDQLAAFDQDMFGSSSLVKPGAQSVATIEEPWLRRVASIIATLETAPIDHTLTLRSDEQAAKLVSQVRYAGILGLQVFFGLAAEACSLENGDNLVLRADWTLAPSATQAVRLQLPSRLRALGKLVSGALDGGDAKPEDEGTSQES